MSGLQADARSMVEHARVESQNHSFHYNERLGVESCTQAICDLALRFGEGADGEESVMSRPFGVALLIAGIDEEGPQLYALSFFLHRWFLRTGLDGVKGGCVREPFTDSGVIDTTPNPRGHSTVTTRKR